MHQYGTDFGVLVGSKYEAAGGGESVGDRLICAGSMVDVSSVLRRHCIFIKIFTVEFSAQYLMAFGMKKFLLMH